MQTTASDFWNNSQQAKLVSKDIKLIKQVLERFRALQADVNDLVAMDELSEAGGGEFAEEAQTLARKIEQDFADIEFQRILSGPHDSASAILSINAGAGGTESCDWAEMLLRMYRMWSDAHGYRNELVDFTLGEQAGFKSATMMIEGDYAYGYLKAEIGVHRLVRISPFDANKRRHTSFVSVFVTPEVEDDIEIEIQESDLRIDTFRASGAGGQKVNKTDSAVRITHIPTNVVVACRNERSQHQNKTTAMKLLKAKLYELEMEKREQEKNAQEATKKKIEWGSQIRSYVLHPYRMVKDHRTDHEEGNADAVLDGKLDAFIRSYLKSKN